MTSIPNRQSRLDELRGQEAGLREALAVLDQLAAPVLERMDADPGGRANRERRPRAKAYHVAAGRIRTRLRRVQRALAAIETPSDVTEHEAEIRRTLGRMGL